MPVSSRSVGVPVPVVTNTVSLNVTVISMTAPALYTPFAVLEEIEVTVGNAVSKGKVSAVAAFDGLLLKSVQLPMAYEIDAVPEEADVGVNVAV